MRHLKKIMQSIYFLINGMAKEGRIFTHLTNEEKIILYTVSKKLRDGSVAVEIGSYLGASSCFISKGLNQTSKLYCIDTWGNHAMSYGDEDTGDNNLTEKDTYVEFRKNTEKYRSKIIELRGWSTEVIKELIDQEKKIDFLFIDGDHNYEGVKADWNLYSPLLTRGSLIAFHDTSWAEGVKKVIKEDVLRMADLVKKSTNLEIYKIKNT